MIQLQYRKANYLDESLYLVWANDGDVRKNAFNREKIDAENHHHWFAKKIEEKDTLMLVFIDEFNCPVGQVRIDKSEYLQVDISVDSKFRRKGAAVFMIETAVSEYFHTFGKQQPIYSWIKKDHIVSIKVFEKAGFKINDDNAHLQYLEYIFIP